MLHAATRRVTASAAGLSLTQIQELLAVLWAAGALEPSFLKEILRGDSLLDKR